jgi:predicted amidohydrolase
LKNTLDISLVQLSSGNEFEENIETASDLIRTAAKSGARFILTPENTGMMESRSGPLFEKVTREDDNPALKAFIALAAELGVWLLVGSLAVRVAKTKLANRSFLIAPDGIRARYDKIHMFDVDLVSGESYRESKNFQAGTEVVTAKIPWGVLGMTVCYDLRFPYLYRRLAQAGAGIISVPSAFTQTTGVAHWRVLLRARAIETGCFILAPAQSGTHSDGRKTFGHSLVVDPWGKVLLDAGPLEVGAFNATLKLSDIDKARAAIPALKHDRNLDT